VKLNISKTNSIELERVEDVGGMTRYGRQFSVQVGEDSGRLSQLINQGVRMHFQMPDAGRFFEGGREAAKSADKVRPAIFLDGQTRFLRMVYKELTLRFHKKVPQKVRKQIMDKFNLKVRQRGHYEQSLYIVHDPSRKILAERIVDVSNEMMMMDEVEIASPNFVSEFQRVAPPTPNAAQWHLKYRADTGQKKDSDVDIRSAWKTTMGSPQVVVAVLDDGVDVDHPNLRDNIVSRPDPNDSRDLVGRDFFITDDDHPEHFNPRPKRFQYPYDRMAGNDIHGTPCAGVIAAAGRVDKIFGAAPSCRILPVKVFHADDLASETRVADAIAYAAMFADVLSCSWSSPWSSIIEATLQDAASGAADFKRGLRGTPIFFAAGNEGQNRVSYPAISDAAICVAATTDQANIASYSNRGAEVWISAPSSGGIKGITTTDVSYLHRGFNTGNEAAGGEDGMHTNSFGGTSSATPLAAGIAALMLSVNRELTLKEIKEILKDTADKIGPAGGYSGNPGHSPAFGYGKVNAGAAVDASTAQT